MRPALWSIRLPSARAEPHGLTVTPDGNLWVALETGALAYVHS
jgi:virginiamycin B lyase